MDDHQNKDHHPLVLIDIHPLLHSQLSCNRHPFNTLAPKCKLRQDGKIQCKFLCPFLVHSPLYSVQILPCPFSSLPTVGRQQKQLGLDEINKFLIYRIFPFLNVPRLRALFVLCCCLCLRGISLGNPLVGKILELFLSFSACNESDKKLLRQGFKLSNHELYLQFIFILICFVLPVCSHQKPIPAS